MSCEVVITVHDCTFIHGQVHMHLESVATMMPYATILA